MLSHNATNQTFLVKKQCAIPLILLSTIMPRLGKRKFVSTNIYKKDTVGRQNLFVLIFYRTTFSQL